LKEYKILESSNYEVGQQFGVEMFEVGQAVAVTGFTIRKGKRWKHNVTLYGLMTHGSKSPGYKDLLDRYITRTFSREKMSGRHSMEKRTIRI
jgi:large subunit ribosomal protein L3